MRKVMTSGASISFKCIRKKTERLFDLMKCYLGVFCSLCHAHVALRRNNGSHMTHIRDPNTVRCCGKCAGMRELEARVRSIELSLTSMKREQSNIQTQRDTEDLTEEAASNSDEPSNTVSHRVQLNL
jgi:hypothetical protein